MADPIIYFGDEAEHHLLDQDVGVTATPTGYTQQDVEPQIEDAWDHFQTDDDDYVVVDDSQLAGVAAAPPQPPEDGWDWSRDDTVVEPTTGGFTQQDIEPQIEDAWDHFVIDDDDQVLADDYQLASIVPSTTQYFGEDAELLDQADDELLLVEDTLTFPGDALATDGWDHFAGEDDEQVVLPNDPTDGLAAYYGEDAELADQDDDEQVLVFDSLPEPDSQLQYFGQDAELADQDSDDQLLDDTGIGVDYNVNLCVEDPWDWFVTDDDDYVVIDDYPQQDVLPNALQYFGEHAELLDQDDDDQVYPDTDTLGATLAQVFDDGFDFWGQEDDDYQLTLDQFHISVGADHWNDEWDHFAVEDDEQQPLDETQQSASDVPFSDGWDHFAAEDDEQLNVEDPPQFAALVNPLLCAEDAWDHFLTDDSDDYLVVDDYELPVIFVAYISGLAFGGGIALGLVVGPMLRPHYGLDPRFFNGSNAWLGFRTATGGGIW